MADFDNTSKPFVQDEIELFTSLASQSANVVYQTQLFHETQVAKDREETLRKIISTIRSTLDINKTFQTISEELVRLFNADRVFLVEFPNMNNLDEWNFKFDYIKSDKMVKYQDVRFDPRGGQYWGNFYI